MTSLSLILALNLLPNFVSMDTPHEERLKKHARFLHPSPGTMLKVSEADKIYSKDDVWSIRGYVEVRPDPGYCIIVQKSGDMHTTREEDVNVCKKTLVPFRLIDLDRRGRLNWVITAQEGDTGLPVSWPTPYRLAQIIEPGREGKWFSEYRPIQSCEASILNGVRRIEIQLFSGEKWVINFPKYDIYATQPLPSPNLFMQKQRLSGMKKRKEEAKMTDAEKEAAERAKQKVKERLKRLFSGAEEIDSSKFWELPERNSFEMSASHFQVNNAPKGMLGICRYRMKGAPEEPSAGIIECHQADSYDAVFIPLTCSVELPVYPAKRKGEF